MAKATFKKRRNQEAILIVGNNVRKLRKMKGWTISEFAFRCEVDPHQISRIELGLTDANITMLTLIAEKLEVDIRLFFKKDEQ
ncbi:transcriptional regulator with XRE-family HTH domain [Pedobacter cryoconitis]|uniref:Transcriptional regulator with XRE-family HTH domain n=1 Tax=Pedobacter cryoconitis TaxID=188932 RepID=A0A7W8YTX8_9SPHI|nr:helix-turn-helix transcriptional regulator [Pedobacter cryoconitis]MBB5621538.1 transcriptional regulator with XRE-family HTH domain [Pedobacter cryoconitis]